MIHDQASGLRLLASRLRRRHGQAQSREGPTRLICVTSGKGGVGKTNISANLGIALASLGSSVVLFDADLGLANLDMVMGLAPRFTLEHYMRGEVADLFDIVTEGPEGVHIVAGGNGIAELANLPEGSVDRLLRGIMRLQELGDTIVIDTGAGIHQAVMSFIVSAHETILVTTPEPTAVADAYAVIKVVSEQVEEPRILLLVNMVKDERHGQAVMDRLIDVARQFIGVRVRPLGLIPYDDHVSQSVQLRQPFLLQYPGCAAARRLRGIAEQLSTRQEPPRAHSGLAAAVVRLRRLFFARA
jgi:flagellar biosynthesis protein FlhG